MSAALDPRVLLAIAVGGGLGSVLRYLVAFFVTAQAGPGFPWGTLLINITGSLLIGVISEITQTRAVGAPNLVRLFWMVGVLGGYTTFSTFSLDAVTLIGDRVPWLALAYLCANVILGVIAAFIGIAAVRAVMTPF
jgi:fluoride exporter